MIMHISGMCNKMNDCVRFIVYRDHMIFDDIIIKLHGVLKYEKHNERLTLPVDDNDIFYITTLSKSCIYRKNAMRILKHFQTQCGKSFDVKHSQIILIRLRVPRRQFLDYKWSEKLMQMVIEKQEADHAMSWLSTLGGAFSALGEEFEHCAKMAGKISVKQFELALRLDNPLLIARCRLYAALSFIQRGYFTTPKYMIQTIYKFAIREKDVRLQNMCQGVWAKLRYNYKQYKQQKKSLLLKTLHISSEI